MHQVSAAAAALIMLHAMIKAVGMHYTRSGRSLLLASGKRLVLV